MFWTRVADLGARIVAVVLCVVSIIAAIAVYGMLASGGRKSEYALLAAIAIAVGGILITLVGMVVVLVLVEISENAYKTAKETSDTSDDTHNMAENIFFVAQRYDAEFDKNNDDSGFDRQDAVRPGERDDDDDDDKKED